MLRCARSGHRPIGNFPARRRRRLPGALPSPRPPGVGGSGSARPAAASRRAAPGSFPARCRPSRASPAGKSARSNVFLQILVLSQDFRTTSDLLPSEANSAPLLRGAVLRTRPMRGLAIVPGPRGLTGGIQLPVGVRVNPSHRSFAAGEEETEHEDHVGDVESAIAIGVAGLLARRSPAAGEEVVQSEDGGGDVDLCCAPIAAVTEAANEALRRPRRTGEEGRAVVLPADELQELE